VAAAVLAGTKKTEKKIMTLKALIQMAQRIFPRTVTTTN
jgi:hypothetical protein